MAHLDIFQCGRRVTFYVMSFHDNTNVTNLQVKSNSGLSYTVGVSYNMAELGKNSPYDSLLYGSLGSLNLIQLLY